MEEIVNNNGQIYAYVRVSSEDESLTRQLNQIEKSNYKIHKIFQDKYSGKNFERPEFQKMLEVLRDNDWLVISSLDRISRSSTDLHKLLEYFQKNEIKLISLRENFDFTSPNGALYFTLLAGIAQFERALIRERQAEGIRLAKLRGVYKGRKKVDRPANFDECFEKYKKASRYQPYTIRNFAKETNLKISTLYRFIKEKETLLLNV